MSHGPAPDRAGATRLAVTAGAGSVAVALILTVLKLWALWHTGSLAVGASLADSALDLLMSATALAAIIYAAKPEDEDHSFGHHSAEDLAVLAQSVVILGSGALIGFLSLSRILSPTPPDLGAEGAGLRAMGIAIGLTVLLLLWQSHVLRRTGNRVVAADRLHYLSDLLPTLGAILALELSRRFGWSMADALIGLAAAAFMIWNALGQFGSAWHALMDRQADPEVIATVTRLADNWPGVRGWHDLHTRRSGSRNFIHLHLEMDGDLSLREAHDIGAALKAAILRELPDAYVIIHKDVWAGETASRG